MPVNCQVAAKLLRAAVFYNILFAIVVGYSKNDFADETVLVVFLLMHGFGTVLCFLQDSHEWCYW